MSADNYEALDRFISNWFHQDWDMEARSWPELIEKFKVVASKERVLQVHAELKALLRDTKDDNALDDMVFEEFGCGYDPRPEHSVRDWLTQLSEILKPPRKRSHD